MISVCWRSEVNLEQALQEARDPNLDELRDKADLAWLPEEPSTARLEVEVELALHTCERGGTLSFDRIDLRAAPHLNGSRCQDIEASIRPMSEASAWRLWWAGREATQVEVELDHFIPYLSINRRNLGPRHSQRSHYNGYLLLFAQPLEQLRGLLESFQYLGANRPLPTPLYRPSSAPPKELGISGEHAAQLIHARRDDPVHYLRPLVIEGEDLRSRDELRCAPFAAAINDIFEELDVRAPLRIEDLENNVGFRLFFGQAPLTHVGRGLAFLLPMIELGLFADPLRFTHEPPPANLEEYLARCPRQTPIALEEPEAHLHPKLQTRLAHWFVALARAGRQLLVETHSDHLVRRLRGLAARAEPGSELERWLLEEVSILHIEQDPSGHSRVETSHLTPEGGLGEHWPADFMDEASDEESEIYYAGLDKQAQASPPPQTSPSIRHDEGEDPEV